METIIIFAVSNSEGQFKELLRINDNKVIKFLKGNEHGVHSVKINNNGKEEIIYYIDFIELY